MAGQTCFGPGKLDTCGSAEPDLGLFCVCDTQSAHSHAHQTQLSTETLVLSKLLVAAIHTLVYVIRTYLFFTAMVMVGGVDYTCWGGYLPSECSAGDPFQSTLKMGSNPNYLPMSL